MLVREVMSNEAITVPLGTTVKSALARAVERKDHVPARW